MLSVPALERAGTENAGLGRSRDFHIALYSPTMRANHNDGVIFTKTLPLLLTNTKAAIIKIRQLSFNSFAFLTQEYTDEMVKNPTLS